MTGQTRSIPLKEATEAQLRAFAESHLGITFPAGAKTEAIRGKIAAAWGQPDIILADDEPAQPAVQPPTPVRARPEASPARALRGSSGRGDPQVSLLIHEQEGSGGKRPVFLSVNGVGMLVPRGQIVTIPYRYYEVLKNAIRTLHEQDQNTGEITSRDVPAYPYQIHAMPSREEVEAWLKAQEAPPAKAA